MSAPAVALVVTPDFSPFHLSVPCILFGEKIAARKLFDLKLCGITPGTVNAAAGFSVVATHGVEAIATADIVIIPFWHSVNERPPQVLLDALVAAHRNGAQIVGLCLGAFVLGYAGLLDGRHAATHWEYEHDFQRLFPRAQLDINALYRDDDRLITSAGTAAALDCCLYLIRQRVGSATANQIARRMIVPPHREGGQAQFIAHAVPQTTQDARINTLIAHLRDNLNQPHDLDTLAALASMSRRTLTRHFIKATGQTVADWIAVERLRRSQALLEGGDLSVEHIAEHVGFRSAITFRQQFKHRFGVSPSEWRKTFRGQA
ncbi:AraC family transcriptional regulator [Superficieibacter electus]|uniref:AraC family transcriptional regulator n=1 Tax=Superficieibacter electus TaxID=2022662 RepID=A0A2P5GMV5_9ENTR|nr:helix-turn-helix domain-containing protein [Superficieibacter electus]POP44655.1 AraC family transcriptional regulator [Superficieibacter electus]POP47456.1 AraC family transcriptional regulator [Superficieibacter electus]